MKVYWLVFVSLTGANVIWEEGPSIEKMPPNRLAGSKQGLQDTVLINDCPLWVAPAWAGGPGFMRK